MTTKEEFLESTPVEKRHRIHFAPVVNGYMEVPVTQVAHLNDEDIVVAVDDCNNVVGWTYVKNVKQPANLRF